MGSDRTKFYVTIYVVIVFISLVNGLLDLEVSMTPSHVHIREGDEETITCSSKIPAKRCEIRVFNLNLAVPTLLPLQENERNDERVTQSARDSNSGTETEGRNCSITLSSANLTEKCLHAVVCRVRSEDSAWAYAYMSVYKSNAVKINLEPNNKQIVKKLWEKLEVYIKSSDTLLGCYLRLMHYDGYFCLFQTNGKCDTSHGYKYYSQVSSGQKNNYCGTTTSHVDERGNGIFTFLLKGSQFEMEETFVLVTITKPPNLLTLTHDVSVSANGTRILRVVCTVAGSRPAAGMRWFLENELLPAEHLRSLIRDDWLWPFNEQTVSQELTLTLTDQHVHKAVTCEVSHVTLKTPQLATLRISEDFLSVTPATQNSPPPIFQHLDSSTNVTQPTELDLLQTLEKKIDIWFVVLVVLLIILFILTVVGFLCCCCRPYTMKEKGSVRYRRCVVSSLDSSTGHTGTAQPPCALQNPRTTDSTLSQASATTGVEFAEIRASMVQRCVEKINASNGRPSSETGEMVDERMQRNSLYLSYGDEAI